MNGWQVRIVSKKKIEQGAKKNRWSLKKKKKLNKL